MFSSIVILFLSSVAFSTPIMPSQVESGPSSESTLNCFWNESASLCSLTCNSIDHACRHYPQTLTECARYSCEKVAKCPSSAPLACSMQCVQGKVCGIVKAESIFECDRMQCIEEKK